MRCLITGANGFAASHLADHLVRNHEVWGTVRMRSRLDNISHLDSLKLVNCDLSDPFGISGIIENIKPDIVFHLAAQSFVGWSWSHPAETIQTNVLGTLNLLEAIRKYRPDCRIHIASSSQVYGANSEPMGKDTLFNPMNPYDTSKLAQDMLALQYFNSYKMNIVRTRAFNISGPKRGDSFAESSWAKQIAENEIYEDPNRRIIYHGNLESSRDYIDVRDVVVAYTWAGFKGKPGELYILGSGKPLKMKEVLETLTSFAKNPFQLIQDKSRMRPSDTPTMQAKDSVLAQIVKGLEGRDLIPFEQTMKDLLDYWRGRT